MFRGESEQERGQVVTGRPDRRVVPVNKPCAQAIGSGAITLATLVVAFALMYAVNLTGTLRISREGELEGLDLHEHGMVAYPEYVIHGYEPTPHQVSPVDRQAVPAAPPVPVTVRPS